jgi:hypothetical protein
MLVLIHLQGCDRNMMAWLLWMFFFNYIIINNIVIVKHITLASNFYFYLKILLKQQISG